MEYYVLNLGEKHLIGILIYLEIVGGRSSRTGLYDNVANNDRMPQKLNILEQMGLLFEQKDRVTRAIWVELTPTGHEVAKLLLNIEDCIRKGMEESAHRE